MKNNTSLKEEFAAKYGIDKSFLSGLSKQLGIHKSKFDYFIVGNPEPSASDFFKILICKPKSDTPIRSILVKKHNPTESVEDIYGGKFKRRNDSDSYDYKRLSFFSKNRVKVYAHIPEHKILLLEAWDTSEEAEFLAEYKKYAGADEYQRKQIKQKIIDTTKQDLNMINEYFQKATETHKAEKELIDNLRERDEIKNKTQPLSAFFNGGYFHDADGNVNLIKRPKKCYEGRAQEYLRAMHLLVLKEIDDKTDRAERSPYIKHARDITTWDDKYVKPTIWELDPVFSSLAVTDGVIHFDPRSSNILSKANGRKRALCDMDKYCLGRRSVDIATKIHDFYLAPFDLTLEDKRQLFIYGMGDDKEFMNSSIWVLLKSIGVPAFYKLIQDQRNKTDELHENEVQTQTRNLMEILNSDKKKWKTSAFRLGLEYLINFREDALKQIGAIEVSDARLIVPVQGIMMVDKDEFNPKPPRLKEEVNTSANPGVTKKNVDANPSQPFQDYPEKLETIHQKSNNIREFINNNRRWFGVAASLAILVSGILGYNTYKTYFSKSRQIEIAKPALEPRDQTIVQVISELEQKPHHTDLDAPKVAKTNGEELEEKVLEQKPTDTSTNSNSTYQPNVKDSQPEPIKEVPVPVSNPNELNPNPPPQIDTPPIIKT